jgi:hypothetical protein
MIGFEGAVSYHDSLESMKPSLTIPFCITSEDIGDPIHDDLRNNQEECRSLVRPQKNMVSLVKLFQRIKVFFVEFLSPELMVCNSQRDY